MKPEPTSAVASGENLHDQMKDNKKTAHALEEEKPKASGTENFGILASKAINKTPTNANDATYTSSCIELYVIAADPSFLN